MSALDYPSFVEPVSEGQSCFRALLEAMARPGTIHAAGFGLMPPPPLASATGAVLLTLIDGDTPLWLDAAVEPAWDWLAFHCGAIRATGLAHAAFACARDMPSLAALATGSDADPETSATLVLQVSSLRDGRPYRLTGPGLQSPALVRIAGLPESFAEQWAANYALYPRGLDLVLCEGEQLCGLPRSVRVEEC